jgi:hypothetical protein
MALSSYLLLSLPARIADQASLDKQMVSPGALCAGAGTGTIVGLWMRQRPSDFECLSPSSVGRNAACVT